MAALKQYHSGSPRTDFQMVPICENPWSYPYAPQAGAGLQTDFETGALLVRLEATEPRTAIRAEACRTNGRVWEDSCLEFFLNPMPDCGNGYLNLETNARGVMLLGVHTEQFSTETDEFDEAFFDMHVQHQFLPEGRIRWTLNYRIPFSYIQRWFPDFSPKPGSRITGNFYKCGDLCQQEHYLAWSPVHWPVPSFHRPECFGIIDL